jgi:NADPH:quinone reductase-like Zn-dependent oxidoreductase
MKAVKILSPGNASVVTDAIRPQPSPSDLLIKVIAVALNPTDWKHIEFGSPATVGCDFAGIVEEIGSAVTRPFEKGDRVWSAIHGSNKLDPDNGAFAEYLVVDSSLVMKIPEATSFEEAASGAVGVITVGQGLYQRMGLPWPNEPLLERMPILIWGGSSASGAMGIQFAKLYVHRFFFLTNGSTTELASRSGFEVITACASHNVDYVKSLGADVVFDSRSSTVGADIRTYTNNKLYYAWDCIGEHGSSDAISNALASSPPPGQNLRHGSIIFSPGTKVHRDDVMFTSNLAYTVMGKAIDLLGFQAPAQPDDYEFAVKWLQVVEKLYEQGKFRTHRFEAREGGFEGILGGLRDLKDGNVSGVKLVYRVAGA